MPHSQGDTIIKTHCLIKGIPSHAFFLHPIFPNQEEEMRGSEKQRSYIQARSHLKEFNSLWPTITSYWSNLKQTDLLVFPFMPIWAMLVTTAQCWNHQKAKAGIQQASEETWSETLGIPSHHHGQLDKLSSNYEFSAQSVFMQQSVPISLAWNSWSQCRACPTITPFLNSFFQSEKEDDDFWSITPTKPLSLGY